MRIEINNPLLWKLLAIIGVSMLIVCTTSCKNGKRLNTGSSGIIRVITPNNLVRQPNGTFRIKSEDIGIPPGNPAPHELPKIKSTPIKPVRTTPKIELKSAEANPVKSKAKAAGSKTKFSPSITDVSKTRMNVVKNDKADVKNTASVKEGDSNLKGAKIAAPHEAKPEKSSSITIKYGELILFYLLGFLIMAFAYIIYDIYKTKKEKKPAPKKPRKRKKPTKPKRS